MPSERSMPSEITGENAARQNARSISAQTCCRPVWITARVMGARGEVCAVSIESIVRCRLRHSTRRTENLRPVDAGLAFPVDRVGHAHLGVLRSHQVRAMAWALDPAVDDRLRGGRTGGDVLADGAPPVARVRNAIRGAAAVAAPVGGGGVLGPVWSGGPRC